jgi:short-subunit dehydrogenase
LKSVIVTGASSGIGRVSAIMLANAGYRVFGLARNYAKLQELSRQLPSENYVPIEFDVTKQGTFVKVLYEIESKGQIFGLVNNAGYVEPGAIEELDMANLYTQFETNFFGLVGLTKRVLPYLTKNNEGRIVNVSSLAGLITLPLIGAYCAAKHALEAVTDAMRMELWGSGIHVVTINPGVIDTNIHGITGSKVDLYRGSRFASAYKKYLLDIPQGLSPTSVGQAVVDAISSKKPRQRYVVGSAKEKAGVKLRPLIPDSVFFSQVAKRIMS